MSKQFPAGLDKPNLVWLRSARTPAQHAAHFLTHFSGDKFSLLNVQKVCPCTAISAVAAVNCMVGAGLVKESESGGKFTLYERIKGAAE